jgi:hypothetical protein
MSQANEPEIQEVRKIVKKHIKETPEQSLGISAFGSRVTLDAIKRSIQMVWRYGLAWLSDKIFVMT